MAPVGDDPLLCLQGNRKSDWDFACYRPTIAGPDSALTLWGEQPQETYTHPKAIFYITAEY